MKLPCFKFGELECSSIKWIDQFVQDGKIVFKLVLEFKELKIK